MLIDEKRLAENWLFRRLTLLILGARYFAAYWTVLYRSSQPYATSTPQREF